MAIKIVGEYAVQEGTTIHQAKHDMESLVYVFIWICVLYGDPRVKGSGPCDASVTCLNAWTSPKTLKQIRNVAVFKRGNLHLHLTVEIGTSLGRNPDFPPTPEPFLSCPSPYSEFPIICY